MQWFLRIAQQAIFGYTSQQNRRRQDTADQIGQKRTARSRPLKRFFKFASLGLLIALLGLYLGDAAVLQSRLQRGSGYRVIQVNQFLATPLKGQKEEYDAIGTIPVTCVRSIFPQRGFPACWWVERHTVQWQ